MKRKHKGSNRVSFSSYKNLNLCGICRERSFKELSSEKKNLDFFIKFLINNAPFFLSLFSFLKL